MTLLTDVKARIDATVPELTGRLDFIAALAALTAEGALPQREIAGFVVPMGFDDRGGQAAAGMYTQMIADTVAVILCVKALGDAGAKRALPTIDALKDAVIGAVAGWAPDSAVGVFSATRGRLVSVTKGLVIYQLDFTLVDQLRIVR
jgi:hypothetical protein